MVNVLTSWLVFGVLRVCAADLNYGVLMVVLFGMPSVRLPSELGFEVWI